MMRMYGVMEKDKEMMESIEIYTYNASAYCCVN